MRQKNNNLSNSPLSYTLSLSLTLPPSLSLGVECAQSGRKGRSPYSGYPSFQLELLSISGKSVPSQAEETVTLFGVPLFPTRLLSLSLSTLKQMDQRHTAEGWLIDMRRPVHCL